jgi:hypothetical protein
MARKSKKGRKAQVADSSSVLQSRENLKPHTQAQETKQQKKKNRPSAGSRKNKHKSAASPKAQAAKLDLPEGYRHPNQQAKKSNSQNRSKKMNNPQVCLVPHFTDTVSNLQSLPMPHRHRHSIQKNPK